MSADELQKANRLVALDRREIVDERVRDTSTDRE
jgi:hypothetical protein